MTLLLTHWRERLLAASCISALVFALSLAFAPSSEAAICKNFGLSANCTITFGGPKTDGGGGKGKGGGKGTGLPPCYERIKGEVTKRPCENDAYGSWSNDKTCYLLEDSVQLEPNDPDYVKGEKLYSCWGYNSQNELVPKDPILSAEPPATAIGGSLVADLETVLQSSFQAPFPGITPEGIPYEGPSWDTARMSPVGAPIWLWANPHPNLPLDPPRIVEESRGYFVDARIDKIEWDMGDGSVFTCPGTGVPYQPYMKDRESLCGHKYKRPGTYLVKSKATWVVDYQDASGPDSVDIPMQYRSVFIRIGENQVVNK